MCRDGHFLSFALALLFVEWKHLLLGLSLEAVL